MTGVANGNGIRERGLALAIIGAAVALAAVGLLAQWSLLRGEQGPLARLWPLHCVWLALGAAVAAAACALPRFIARLALPVHALLAIALLALAAGFGVSYSGSRRYIALGGLTIHVAALFQVASILAIARFASRPPEKTSAWRKVASVLVPLLMVLLPTALLVGQSDLTSAAILFVVSIAMLLGSAHTRIPGLVLAGLGLILPVFLWFFVLHIYQRERFADFFAAAPDALGIGYQSAVLRDVVGSGGLLGQGWHGSALDAAELLQNAHTDFTVAIIGHAWGLAGVLAVLSLYAVLIGSILWIAARAADRFLALVAMGAAALLVCQVGLNVSLNLGLLPVVGTSGLPLISYGGSNTVAVMLCLGLVLAASRRKLEPRAHEPYRETRSALAAKVAPG